MQTITTFLKSHARYMELSLLAVGLMLAGPAQAAYWGASATTAVPEFLASGEVTSHTVLSTPEGNGVASNAVPDCKDIAVSCVGVSRLFVPVTAPLGTEFRTLWLRALDNMQTGYVQAALYRQPISHNQSAPTLMGSVQTQTLTGVGYQVASAPLPSPVRIKQGFTYYIMLELAQGRELSRLGAPVPSVIVFDVGFDDYQPCDKEHPDFNPACLF